MTSIQPSAFFELAHPGKRFQGQFLDGLFAYIFGIIAFYLSDPLVGRDYAVYFGGSCRNRIFPFIGWAFKWPRLREEAVKHSGDSQRDERALLDASVILKKHYVSTWNH